MGSGQRGDEDKKKKSRRKDGNEDEREMEEFGWHPYYRKAIRKVQPWREAKLEAREESSLEEDSESAEDGKPDEAQEQGLEDDVKATTMAEDNSEGKRQGHKDVET